MAFISMAPHLAGRGGDGGDDNPRQPWRVRYAHELDDLFVPVVFRNPAAVARNFDCPVCDRVFSTRKAIHRHMRCHALPSVVGADGRLYLYSCNRCDRPFETHQALGGHRASHSSRKGCFWHSKQNQLAAAAAAATQKPPVHDFDLNYPPPPEEEEDDDEE